MVGRQNELLATHFTSLNPDNFTVTYDNVTVGVMDGKTFSGAKWASAEAELTWLRSEILFQRGFIERLERYLQVREKELAKGPPDAK